MVCESNLTLNSKSSSLIKSNKKICSRSFAERFPKKCGRLSHIKIFECFDRFGNRLIGCAIESSFTHRTDTLTDFFPLFDFFLCILLEFFILWKISNGLSVGIDHILDTAFSEPYVIAISGLIERLFVNFTHLHYLELITVENREIFALGIIVPGAWKVFSFSFDSVDPDTTHRRWEDISGSDDSIDIFVFSEIDDETIFFFDGITQYGTCWIRICDEKKIRKVNSFLLEEKGIRSSEFFKGSSFFNDLLLLIRSTCLNESETHRTLSLTFEIKNLLLTFSCWIHRLKPTKCCKFRTYRIRNTLKRTSRICFASGKNHFVTWRLESLREWWEFWLDELV